MISCATAASLAIVLPALPYDLRDTDALRASHFVSETAHWLIPGRVMQGRHPGSGRGSALARLNGIRAAGCGTFVCLQAELPPQEGSVVLGGAVVEPLPGLEPYAADAAAADPDAPPAFCHYGIRGGVP